MVSYSLYVRENSDRKCYITSLYWRNAAKGIETFDERFRISIKNFCGNVDFDGLSVCATLLIFIESNDSEYFLVVRIQIIVLVLYFISDFQV